MIFKLRQTAGENFRWFKRNLRMEDFMTVRFSETENEYFLHIDFWTFNFVKRIKSKLRKRELWKGRTRVWQVLLEELKFVNSNRGFILLPVTSEKEKNRTFHFGSFKFIWFLKNVKKLSNQVEISKLKIFDPRY